MSSIINHCLINAHFPTDWKSARIVPIPKKNQNPLNPDSYRPISILSSSAKIFERIIKVIIDEHCDSNHSIPQFQFANRPKHSVEHALLVLKSDVLLGLNRNAPTIACLLDIKKAFDSVWQYGLAYKLSEVLQFHPHLCKLILSFLDGRKSQVQLREHLSSPYSSPAGIPQGSVLSATLFSLFTADLPKPTPHPNPIRILQYADDLILYTSTRNIPAGEARLNSYLDELYRYFTRWKLSLNPQKCETIVFHGTAKMTPKMRNDISTLSLKIHNDTIPTVKEVTYLGVTINSRLSHVPHITKALNRATGAFKSLYPILKYSSPTPQKVKLFCYKQLIRPLLVFGFIFWSDTSPHQMERIRLKERRILRHCTNIYKNEDRSKYISNQILYDSSQTPRIDAVLARHALKFLEKSRSHPNPLISQAMQIEIVEGNLLRTHLFPQILLCLQSRNLLFDPGGRVIFYNGIYSSSQFTKPTHP